ncbi:hypothetical protein FVA81_01565 (plasmid) [Rhizobium sp. WL3]|uniref:hypothetical protein n=1 Tax=Rhizobium sp. WL3 TaxID=2603277 RepID=UPI0011C1FC75|nr:hypothetical protein [Rhizobium sp. WL3]QEE43363.1 hypothetical protein FVA81_01565 [Rhizobium sp. WL3]
MVALVMTWSSAASAQGTASASGGSEAEFNSWLGSLKGEALKVTSTGIVYDAAADRLTINGMKLTFGSTVGEAGDASTAAPTILTLDTVQLTGFSTSADGVSFQSANVLGVSLDGASWPSSAITAASLGLENVFLPSLNTFVADPKRPISSQVALLRLLTTAKADTITVAGLNAGQGFSADNVQLSMLARGAMQRVEFTTVASVPQGADAGAAVQRRFAADAVVVSKVDFDPYLRLFEASAYLEAGAARPWRNLVEKAVISGLAYEGDGTRIAADTVTLDAMKARQFPKNITDLFDQAATDPAFLAENQEAATIFATAIRNAFAVDAISVGPSTVTTRNAEGDVKITTTSALVSGLSANSIDAVALEKLGYADTLRTLQAETLRLEGISVPQQIGAELTTAAPAALPQVSVVKLSGFQGKIGEADFAVSQFNLDMSYFLGGTPTNVKMALENLKMGVNQIAVPGIRDTLTAFGYKDIDLSLALAGSWQERSSEIAVENVALAVAGLGRLSASGSMTGVTRAGVENPAAKLAAELAAGGVKNFRLSFQNENFFQSLVKEIAKQNGRTEEEINKALAANMPGIMAAVTPAAIKNKLIFAGVSFVNNPLSLDFVSSTTDVVLWGDLLGALSEPARLPGLLQLDVRANGRQ